MVDQHGVHSRDHKRRGGRKVAHRGQAAASERRRRQRTSEELTDNVNKLGGQLTDHFCAQHSPDVEPPRRDGDSRRDYTPPPPSDRPWARCSSSRTRSNDGRPDAVVGVRG